MVGGIWDEKREIWMERAMEEENKERYAGLRTREEDTMRIERRIRKEEWREECGVTERRVERRM